MSDQQPASAVVTEPSILCIYLRGGGVLVLDQVIECSFRAGAKGAGLGYINLHQAPDARRRLIVGALDLHSVEAMVLEHKPSVVAVAGDTP